MFDVNDDEEDGESGEGDSEEEELKHDDKYYENK